ncbi:hypothetical protein JIG36_20135 [Actinoplanes sp. LDG1-06]|uniref:Uncharacterized protein n=1 Tax=Paractinoplanes ovalisporus TaxID=2810368 RepID=A0ABS2ADN0_9ACTN|nr:hypothetical protein [Actinoplanes ovalisporus]MBM2617870.1 hypothetical protein [Actinoplanes ovalisporus]
MHRSTWARPLLAAGVAVAALTVTTTGAAQAAPRLSAQALAQAAATYEQKLAVAVKFGRGDDFALPELADRDFVVAIWNLVKDDADQAEVRLAAEAAFSAEPDSIDQACLQFIVTGVYEAFDRDLAREKREADEKRASDVARSAAAASIDVVADAALLNGSDADFVRLIWERVADDVKWPKVKAAARAARDGSDSDRTAFIAAGMAAAARQDVDDRIAADEAKTEAEKAAARAREAKKAAANRIGLTVTEELLNLPDRDFVTVVWNFATDGTEVQAAAIIAARSLDPAVWKAFIDTGIHDAKNADIRIALEREEAEDRRLVQAIVDRAVASSQRGLAAAARAALAGDAATVAYFLRVGQYQVGQDVTQFALTTTRLGMLTADGTAYVKEGGLDAPWVKQYTNVKQLVLTSNRIGVLTNAGVALVKLGGLSAGWTQQHTGVKQLVMSADRIGVVRTDNIAWVKQGALNAGWVKQYDTAVTQLALSGTRIGILRPDLVALVKDGTTASTNWSVQQGAVKQLVLSGTRIGVLRTDNVAYVKEGALNASWVTEHSAVRQLTLAGTRIGVVHTDGIVRVKEGGLSALWTQVRTNSYTMALETNRIAVIANDGVGYVNSGTVASEFTTFKMAANPS